jgi:hypothetical protein
LALVGGCPVAYCCALVLPIVAQEVVTWGEVRRHVPYDRLVGGKLAGTPGHGKRRHHHQRQRLIEAAVCGADWRRQRTGRESLEAWVPAAEDPYYEPRAQRSPDQYGTTNIAFTQPVSIYVDGGSGIGDFAESNDCGKILAPKASCTVEVAFEPRDAGLLNSFLYIQNNGGSDPQVIPLFGKGE